MSDDAEGPERPGTTVFEATVRDGVCRLRRPGTRWLSTGYDGGESVGDCAYLVSVPEGWDDVDVSAYTARRRREAGFRDSDQPVESAPTLLTGVSMRHARRARLGPVEAVVTAGVNNPAALPLTAVESPSGAVGATAEPPAHDAVGARAQNVVRATGQDADEATTHDPDDDRPPTGTVNVVVGTTRSLAPGALANLVAVAAEAKTATLLALTGFPGTTSDAVLVGCDPDGEAAAFSGSATAVGSAARACVRDALLASLDSRYAEESPPNSVEQAEYGVVTDERARVRRVDSSGHARE
ncbi:adenosylcobinamide amidohydrolase [Halobellus captivus]|uniref:adenosylcobinamide amidohydrolase n=1 Tax=Halobellus captivus TaxID=2592614 RepID=UPI0011A28601|nr:adenosylcobinamide amidohydrolase [Halobellus captivus]